MKPSVNQHNQSVPGRCPTCDNDVEPDAATVPFCSSRCRLVDLNRWLSGRYVISRPVEEQDLDEAE